MWRMDKSVLLQQETETLHLRKDVTYLATLHGHFPSTRLDNETYALYERCVCLK